MILHKGVTQVIIHVTHMTCYYIYIPIQLHNLFAGRDAFDVVGTTSKNLQEIATSSLNTCLHWWDTGAGTFHAVGSNTESELHPALSPFKFRSCSSHTGCLHVDALFSEVILFLDWDCRCKSNAEQSESKEFQHFDFS